MPVSYEHLRLENEKRYGTDIGRIGKMLLADRYEQRTHFLLELLQNTEDALGRRSVLGGPRSVSFRVSQAELEVKHWGQPFDEKDVRGICGIALSTKDETATAIGQFGIGFKSVYAFTDCPEVHSGDESFRIRDYVLPEAAPGRRRDPNETLIVLPLKADAARDQQAIASGLEKLGGETLLFLRQLEEIVWSVEGGRSGRYVRSESEVVDGAVRRVTVSSHTQGEPERSGTWLVFSRPVGSEDRAVRGVVEIAFSVQRDDTSGRDQIRRIAASPWVVYFPTVLETHLGFLIQGPYQTTPSRDNVPPDEAWNKDLIRHTAELLVEALCWLRDRQELDAGALACLPLDQEKFGEQSRLGALAAAVRRAMRETPLLPRADTGYVAADAARLASSQELRDLVSSSQLAALLGSTGEVSWLSGDITKDRTPELRKYLMAQVGIQEMTPESFLPLLTKEFLEAQTTSWISDLYCFLGRQRSLKPLCQERPLVRLSDGHHVVAQRFGRPQAFLPGTSQSGFPTVDSGACAATEAREFLQTLGVVEPDPVDDVVLNVLRKYRTEENGVSDEEYESDVERILTAFRTDSDKQRAKLVQALRVSYFLAAADADRGSAGFSKPADVSQGSEDLRALFSGVREVRFVDSSRECLQGREVRSLLDACGAPRGLLLVPEEPSFSDERLRQLRIVGGCADITRTERLEDVAVRGLSALLERLPSMDLTEKERRARLLWKALGDVEQAKNKGAFSGTYRWFFSRPRETTFDAAFVRQLNDSEWIPDDRGSLRRPGEVLFDSLGWSPQPFLQSKIRFKAPELVELAQRVGIEPGVLDRLKQLKIASLADLEAMLVPQTLPAEETDPARFEGQFLEPDGYGTEEAPNAGHDGHGIAGEGPSSRPSGRPRVEGGSEPSGRFVTYVMPQRPDHADQSAEIARRKGLGDAGVAVALRFERQAGRDPVELGGNHPGWDVTSSDATGGERFIEVKSLGGDWGLQGVRVTPEEFRTARDKADDSWLYVVERAGSTEPVLHAIRNPVGRVDHFMFDHGWKDLADESYRAVPSRAADESATKAPFEEDSDE